MTTLPLPPDELLTTTRSVRKRLDLTRPVPLELVRECLEVALQAPTGGNRQGWHWLVVTEPSLRSGIAEYYKRSYDAYRGSRPAPVGNTARETTRRRVSSSSDHLADHLAEVPVLVLGVHRGCRRAARGEPGRAVGLAAAGSLELPAGRPGPRPGHGVDDPAPDLRARGRRAARHPGRMSGRACCCRRPTTPVRRSGRRRANRSTPCSTSSAGSHPSSQVVPFGGVAATFITHSSQLVAHVP